MAPRGRAARPRRDGETTMRDGGEIERIHRTDVDDDGHVAIILPNAHGRIERGPTWICTQAAGPGHGGPRRELPNDSGPLGQEIGRPPAGANWLRHQAVFTSANGCRSPRLREVAIDLLTGGEGRRT